MTHNANRGKGGRRLKPEHFMPDPPRAVRRPRRPNQRRIRSSLRAVFKRHNETFRGE